LIRAVPVLVAANIEPRGVLIRRAILADVRVAPDSHDGPETKSGRTRDDVPSPADIRSGGCNARMRARLARDGVISGNIRLERVSFLLFVRFLVKR
jgi:hypothetical protein